MSPAWRGLERLQSTRHPRAGPRSPAEAARLELQAGAHRRRGRSGGWVLGERLAQQPQPARGDPGLGSSQVPRQRSECKWVTVGTPGEESPGVPMGLGPATECRRRWGGGRGELWGQRVAGLQEGWCFASGCRVGWGAGVIRSSQPGPHGRLTGETQYI